ncbi:MAG: peptidylprolyl isomerase, partial [Gammaproteobacteria bacterium]|nr:peptidylprolyl isomerase [Gammaproteobacteria bacterium]
MRNALRSLTLIAAVVMLAACGGQQNSADTSTVLATVNGVPITNDMFRAYVRSLAGGQEPQLDAQRRQLVLNRLIDMEVLAQAAQKSGLEKQATVAADLNIQRTGLLAQQLVQQYLTQHPVTEDQIKAEYAARTKSMPGTEYRARHILVASEQQAKAIVNQLNHGANFATLAKKYSTDASGKQGGELGWFSPDQMVPAFSAAVAKLKKGEYTKVPVHTQYGWHVIQLEDTRSTPPPSLDSVRDQLTNSLEGQQVEAYVNK